MNVDGNGTSGQVLTSDGDGTLSWGAGGSFDLHDDTTELVGQLDVQDRMLISDESATGDPNRYVEIQNLGGYLGNILYDGRL